MNIQYGQCTSDRCNTPLFPETIFHAFDISPIAPKSYFCGAHGEGAAVGVGGTSDAPDCARHAAGSYVADTRTL
ncbi:hypothetical protein EVAR_18150_1 [Eumeta japonica]|uniref:Uncharacterized protein n=1 Tax=Eumeta variegata TaxID=151549 RepID=A0A4C1UV38_EUMVA|nr:hypothetical protein EVAR_18150_1 [Eumeta japonica]